jgi:hypothetical protein
VLHTSVEQEKDISPRTIQLGKEKQEKKNWSPSTCAANHRLLSLAQLGIAVEVVLPCSLELLFSYGTVILVATDY